MANRFVYTMKYENQGCMHQNVSSLHWIHTIICVTATFSNSFIIAMMSNRGHFKFSLAAVIRILVAKFCSCCYMQLPLALLVNFVCGFCTPGSSTVVQYSVWQ